MSYYSIGLMILFSLIHCYDRYKPPKIPLKEDSLIEVHTSFNIYNSKMPDIEKTTEEDIYKLYPEGPSILLTFPNIFTKNVNGTEFCVERILEFIGSTNKSVNSEDLSGYIGWERVYYTVFICDSIVTYYSIVHKIRPKNNVKEWIPGKFDTGDSETGAQWPNSTEDMNEYFKQKPEKKIELERIYQ